MSYPIPHFRDRDDPTLELRAAMAEAELANLRRYSGRPEVPVLEPAIRPPPITLPPLREMTPVIHPWPGYDPIIADRTDTCGGLPPGFVITSTGLRRRD